MMKNDSLTSKWSNRIMKEDEGGLRTIECLRGRLFAERAASKAANHESQQINKKVIELEKQLKMEIKSRNKAEKRLNFLMKKLQSLNISYVSSADDESSEKSVISSVSSSNTQLTKISKCVIGNDTSGETHNCPSQDANCGSLDNANSNEDVIQSSQKACDEYHLQREDNNGSKSIVTQNNIDNEEHHNVDNSLALIMVEEKSISTPGNEDDLNDNSMAIVAVNSMVQEEKKDALISNGNVKDVLDALRYARECLETSMEMRRHMKSNIALHRLDRISC
ncbi:hypothetical protein QVD17_36351 [Tagetes erecta]|uniref:Uncharacterized protein n=1 Tax=Tagetes erecta TaxID=13708 RepID=A0AAD8JS81_TARER|nr:hypothetical protein QVD17_36349 [Tagetes erecta]KAK1409822.1 hypothetical protein QVD17_36351 [Tagetes erecta]